MGSRDAEGSELFRSELFQQARTRVQRQLRRESKNRREPTPESLARGREVIEHHRQIVAAIKRLREAGKTSSATR